MKHKKVLIAAAALLGLAGVALAQPVITRVNQINSDDLFLDIPHGVPSAQSQYAPATLLGNYPGTLAGNNYDNTLIGGDAGTNLWQRATTGSSVTTTSTYGGPDRWAYASGTSTAMTVSRTSTAGDLPATQTYQYGFKMARTSGQTGVVEVCMYQAVDSANSYQYSGQTAEVDFHATAGSTLSSASGNMHVYIATGTGTDEGSAKMIYGINAGGGAGAAWTGQVNRTMTVTLNTNANSRYTVAAPIPSGTTEIGVALCFTPVGTAGANDYIAFSGIQLTRNSGLATAAGTAGATLDINDPRGKAFARRPQQIETALQQRYFYKLTETSAVAPVAPCAAVDTTHTNCLINLPVTMRIAPTGAFVSGFATPTSTTQATLGACTLTAAATVSSTVGSVNSYLVNCAATTVPAAGVASFLYSNNGSGTISLSSEL